MSTKRFLAVCVFGLILFSCFLAFESVNIGKSLGVVRIRQDFGTIQEAINNARSGDIIRVAAGTCRMRRIVWSMATI